MMLLTFLASLALNLPAVAAQVVPLEILNEGGFETEYLKSRHGGGKDPAEPRTAELVTYSGSRQRTRLKVTAFLYDRQGASELVNTRLNPGGYRGMIEQPPSGMPIGTDCRHSMHSGRAFLFVTTRFETVQCIFTPPAGVDAKGFFKPAEHDWTTDRPLFERIVRHTVARAAGQRLRTSGNTTMAGATVPTAMCMHSSQVFGKMSTWCVATGWTVSSEAEYGSYTLRKGAHYAVVPIGGNAIKIDGAWTKLPDVSAMVDGSLYLPKAAFERLAE